MNSWLIRIGSIMASGGVIWAVYVATSNADVGAGALSAGLQRVFNQRGPMEICGLGVLLWLIGKWRSYVEVR